MMISAQRLPLTVTLSSSASPACRSNRRLAGGFEGAPWQHYRLPRVRPCGALLKKRFDTPEEESTF